MARYTVLIADSRYQAYDEERAVFDRIGADVVVERSDREDVLVSLMPGMDGLLVNLAPVTERLVTVMDRCKCVSRYGVGYDNVDTKALKSRGIALANVPDYCGEDVSDHAIALLMDSVRKIARKDRHVRRGEWNLTCLQKVFRIRGKTLGLVGYGFIGRILHRKLRAFELGRVLVFDPYVTEAAANEAGAEAVDLDTLLRESDFVSLHAPLSPATAGMIGARQFGLMKETAVLINTSRGGLVDEPALAAALREGQIACAGIDVFPSEPLAADSELRTLDNLTMTDHAGWYSEEAMSELKTKAAENVAAALVDGRPRYPVVL